ncbi:MAG: hypothetical protein LBQ66_10825 [Planctomycetaceae bacterium]|nr:hypothetical protein [Planctomycetaceae bacterium]
MPRSGEGLERGHPARVPVRLPLRDKCCRLRWCFGVWLDYGLPNQFAAWTVLWRSSRSSGR